MLIAAEGAFYFWNLPSISNLLGKKEPLDKLNLYI